MVIAQGSGDYFRGGSTALIDQDQQRQVGQGPAGRRSIGVVHLLVVSFAPGREDHSFVDEVVHDIHCLVEIPSRVVAQVEDQAVHARGPEALDRLLHLAEQLLEVDDVAVVLVVPVEPVRPADGLEQGVVPQLAVEIDVRAARRVEAGQELADDDQELQVRRLLDETALRLVLVLLRRLAPLQDVLRVGVELVALVAVGGFP